MLHMLDVEKKPIFDHSITAFKERTYHPYVGTTFAYNDEIRIPIRKQEYCLLPSQSSIHIKGKLTNKSSTVPTTAAFINNFGAFLFTECRYELNGVEIDRTRNLGVASTMKGYASLKSNSVSHLENAGWHLSSSASAPSPVMDSTTGRFHIIIPLNLLLGFAEDFQKSIIDCTHELVLIRSSNDNCTIKAATDDDESFIAIDKIYWKMPYISPSDAKRVQMLNVVSKNEPLYMAFRSWEIYEYPSIPNATKCNWCIKSSSQLEKPRFIIFGFQTNSKKKSFNSSVFTHCNIAKLKLFLNEDFYPYDDVKAKFGESDFAEMYEMYAKFRNSYYQLEDENNAPLLNRSTYKSIAPLIVIDCSQQNDSIRSSPVDIRVEIETHVDIENNTSFFALILHDRVATYKPLTGEVNIQQ